MSKIYDYALVGAGLTGLQLADLLNKQATNLSVKLLDKSKSCGGRMATRRVGDHKFDHGAQFIKVADESRSLISQWMDLKLIGRFSDQVPNSYHGVGGMTQPAKKMAEALDISYNFKLERLTSKSGAWDLTSDLEDHLSAKNVILTCPLPQSLDILDNSKISYTKDLRSLHYSKALVLLVDFDRPLHLEKSYYENFDSFIFSVTSQKHKGLSDHASYTVVLRPEVSHERFEMSDNENLQFALIYLKEIFSDAKVLDIQLKKWRYCQPTKVWPEPFLRVEEGLYLAGDAFGGASLNGALRSAQALYRFLGQQ